MDLHVFDDERAASWEPFALTRPVGELRFGAHTFRARAERFAGVACTAHVVREGLASFEEPGAAPVVSLASVRPVSDRARLFLCSRAVPAGDARFTPPDGSGLVRLGERAAGWYVAAGDEPPPGAFFRDPDATDSDAPTVSAHAGRLLDRVWQLVTGMPAQVEADFAAAEQSPDPAALPAGVHVRGDADGRLWIAPDAHIEPGVLLDVTHGPIRIDAGSEVRAFSRIAGPSWIGPRATLLGGVYDAVSIGPVCRVHGEVEESTFLGWSNKAHDGFIGHAYVGTWVNLGALTTNSDLKNTYGTIRITTPAGEVDTGAMKLGCLLGDHVKTGIGVMLNTGTVVGAGSNLFGAMQPPKYVPPFSWGSGSELVEYRLDRFMAVAEHVMGRRKVGLAAGMRAVLETAWAESRGR